MKSKLHSQVFLLLKEIYPGNNLIQEYSYSKLLNKRSNPLLISVSKRYHVDIYDMTLGIIYEIQGEQHISVVEFFGGEEAFYSQKKRDDIKRQIAIESNKKMVEIPYDIKLTKENLLSLILES